MTAITAPQFEPTPIIACTVSRDVQNFDLLIEDMEAMLGEGWGDLGFDEALTFLTQPESGNLKFIAMAIDAVDEADLGKLGAVIARARARNVKIIVIAEDVTPAALHQLLRQGAHAFVPYPLPEGELQAALNRIEDALPPEQGAAPRPNPPTAVLTGGGDGVLIAVQGLAGGTGATTMAVNLAHELTLAGGKNRKPRVCLVDLGLQFGTVATYLDIERRDAVLELLTDLETVDDESFAQALETLDSGLRVFTSPPDILPLDIVGPDEVTKILGMARKHFDFIVLDMPSTLVHWSETVLTEAQVYFATLQLDMRSAQNTVRLKRALQAEDLPFEKLRFVLNRAPRFTDLQGKARVKRMADSLGIALDVRLPDGGLAVAQACDHGAPLASIAPKNPLRREIAKLACDLLAIGDAEAQAA
jgi:pilus assembly protein CpaE